MMFFMSSEDKAISRATSITSPSWLCNLTLGLEANSGAISATADNTKARAAAVVGAEDDDDDDDEVAIFFFVCLKKIGSGFWFVVFGTRMN